MLMMSVAINDEENKRGFLFCVDDDGDDSH